MIIVQELSPLGKTNSQGNIMQRNLTLHKDNNGRYLEVPTEDLYLLGIDDLISGKSFSKGNFAFLHFDSDAILYMVATYKQGWDIKVSQRLHDEIPCRNHSKFPESELFSHQAQVQFLEHHRTDTRNLPLEKN